MTLSKGMIHFLGGFAVGLLVLLGGALGAYPLWSSAFDAHDETETVIAQNNVQRLQLTHLQARQSELPTIQQRVTALQDQIPPVETWESLVRLAESGTNDDVVLRRIEPGTMSAYVDRTEPFDSNVNSNTVPAEAAAQSGELSQIRVTIVASATTMDAAVDYLDDLRDGPRLIGVDSAAIDDSGGEDYPFVVTVIGRTYVAAG